MNCHECLSELATGSLRDLTPDSAVMLHCVTCPYCGPLATALRDREYNAATILNNLPPTTSPITVAETAAMVSRRRRLGKVAVFLTGWWPRSGSAFLQLDWGAASSAVGRRLAPKPRRSRSRAYLRKRPQSSSARTFAAVAAPPRSTTLTSRESQRSLSTARRTRSRSPAQ